MMAFSRKGLFVIANSWEITKSITNERLKKRGLLDPLEYYQLRIA